MKFCLTTESNSINIDISDEVVLTPLSFLLDASKLTHQFLWLV